MDLWVVAALAGAGCLAKYFSRLSKNDDSSSHLSLDRRASDASSVEGLLAIELASNKRVDNEKVKFFRNCDESDGISVSDFNDIEDGNQQSSNIGSNCGFMLPDLSAGELGYVHNHSGNKTFVWTKNLYGPNSRPLHSL